ncbi:MAG: hypothetical protein QOD81_1901 [Solirubrobacteraceae bacterium]|jgi:hypothetical protein|nr:hypothetical protein [Solirubrobacteraceae bacterium]
MRKTIVACTVTALAIGGGTASAAKLITSKDIADGAVHTRDIAKDTISLSRLSPSVRAMIAQAGTPGKAGVNGANGRDGAAGATGAKGDAGTKGDTGAAGAGGANGVNATVSSGNWGVMARNTIGSPDIFTRSGPAAAPYGTGSLGFSVGGGTEKAAYGNEADFAGDLVSGLTQVGFSVYTTGENAALGNPNMPSIAIEIDPNLTATPSNFSTLVFVPSNTAPNAWTKIDATDATKGFWFLTGAAGAATNCNQTTTCSFAQVQAALNDGGESAVIGTVGVTKGRDFAWQGAIDGLQINSAVYDFEETGVVTRAL